jgi:hypothetical protein
MMFIGHVAFSLELLVFAFGACFFVFHHKDETAKKFTKFVAYFLMIMAVLSMICTTFFIVITEPTSDCCYGNVSVEDEELSD